MPHNSANTSAPSSQNSKNITTPSTAASGLVEVAPPPDLRIAEQVATLRKAYDQAKPRSIEWRKKQLFALETILNDHGDELAQAIHLDVGKPLFEAQLTEVVNAKGRIVDLRKNLKRYTANQGVPTVLAALPGKSYVVTEALGVVLIVSPWNFPLELTFSPLAGAIAAGNCVVVKPSEIAPATSALMARLLHEYLDGDCIRVVEGGVPETTELLKQRFDHIFYTGSGVVGRIVLKAAAKHLTPVTLELGGKNPVIVDQDCNLEVSARRIVWGKFLACGQMCVAPDYLLVHQKIFDRLLREIKKTILDFYGDDPQKSEDFGRIVNERHFRRLMKLVESGGLLSHGGQSEISDQYIAPTILTDVPLEAPIMQEEIFGPLMPLVPISDIEEAISFVNARPKPLALYYFGKSSKNRDAVIERTSSGGVAINQTFFQLMGHHLPFGGVGESGMGAYHGRYSVDTFSHKKSVLDRPIFFDPKFVYPPSTKATKKWLKHLL